MRCQQNDKPLIETAKLNKDYSIKHFHGVDKISSLIKQEVEWYHNALCHLGVTRTELSIAQHFYWKILHKTVHEACSNSRPISF